MARIVIADAGPLIAFANVDALSVLRALFYELYVPEAVKDECLSKPGIDTNRIEVAIDEGWLVISPRTGAGPLSPSLGLGESDSIRLARENQEESLLIVDDRLARRYALKQGLNIVGTVRLLDLAEQQGLIVSAEQSICEMASVGYRISVELLMQIREK
ncbi:MAG: hypothetical protein ABW148_09505 [Sedimenticola sp.]